MSSTGWTYTLSSRAQRSLKKLPPDDRRRVIEALDRLVSDPMTGDIKKLQGERDQWRLRVGSLRIIFVPDMKQQVILVRNLGYRPTIYRD